MSKVKTDKVVDGKSISYEVIGNGYTIFLGEKPWIEQIEPYIPYPELGYEGSCLKQIESITVPIAPALEERLEKLEQENTQLKSALEALASGITNV